MWRGREKERVVLCILGVPGWGDISNDALSNSRTVMQISRI